MLLNKPSLSRFPIGREGGFVGKLTVTYPDFTLLIKIKISAILNRVDIESAPFVLAGIFIVIVNQIHNKAS
ncbi:hypothetical protein SAMN02746062_01475 [Alysiella filiformis DSM 16848]|uniref:Uncharacterized protein n=1 Tax=Alysiella filiformis DSM 16848 TaxID=1120981 RepID=A0A286EDL7_9NEIS|nr:hypothetical protein SAMN02746062_01475 [Alysiella filiformis DSM 16848]